MKPPKGPPVFFNQFDHGIYWKYHAIYTSIIYLCDTMDGCQILHQLRDVVKSPWVSTIQKWCRISQESTVIHRSFLSQNSGLVASLLEQQWLLYVILIAFDKCFLGLPLQFCIDRPSGSTSGYTEVQRGTQGEPLKW